MSSNQISIRIILLGDRDVGKTCILKRYIEKKYDEIKVHSVGFDKVNKTVLYGKTEVQFDYWDTVGQEKYQSMAKHYLVQADGICYVFDMSRKSSIEKLTEWHNRAKETVLSKNIQLMLIGNKCDLTDQQEMTQESIDAMKEQLGCSAYFETSAKDNINIDQCFEYLENEILKIKDMNVFNDKIALTQKKNQIKEKSCCCSLFC